MTDDRDRRQYELDRATAEAAHSRQIAYGNQLTGIAAESGENAIKAGAVINGGAAIALLALLGSVHKDLPTAVLAKQQLADCFLLYSSGVFLSAFASSIAYLTNTFYARSMQSIQMTYDHPYLVDTRASRVFNFLGQGFNYLAMAVVLLSYAAFGYSSWLAWGDLSSLL